MSLISGGQIRAARALLGISAANLAQRAKIGHRTLQRFEGVGRDSGRQDIGHREDRDCPRSRRHHVHRRSLDVARRRAQASSNLTTIGARAKAQNHNVSRNGIAPLRSDTHQNGLKSREIRPSRITRDAVSPLQNASLRRRLGTQIAPAQLEAAEGLSVSRALPSCAWR